MASTKSSSSTFSDLCVGWRSVIVVTVVFVLLIFDNNGRLAIVVTLAQWFVFVVSKIFANPFVHVSSTQS